MFLLILLLLGVISAVYILVPRRTRRYCTESKHQDRLDRVIAHLRRRPSNAKLSLHRRSLLSNTIRNASHKSGSEYFPVDLSSFNHIIEINAAEGYVVCEPGILFSDLLKELLRHDQTALVIVELPGITVGGAIQGGSLESSSFKFGQLSDTVLEMEVLAPQKYVCSPTLNSDLFYAISASYNTVALLTKVKLAIHRAPKYLSLRVDRYDSFDNAATALKDITADCIEGIAYSPNEIAVIQATHTDTVRSPLIRFSRHYDRWYYKTARDTERFTVPYWDYCFRYNYGAFWMAGYVLDMLGGDSFVLRLAIGFFLDTTHLFAVLHSAKLSDLGRMRIIQDCYVPQDHVVPFLQDVHELVGVYPLWLCPIKATATPQHLACHRGDVNLVNVGIYGRPAIFPFPAPVLGKGLVDLLIKHNARSMLYAQTWHTAKQFDTIYGEALAATARVKAKYGSDCFYDLYRKVALSDKEREEMAVPVETTEEAAQAKIVRDIIVSKFSLS